VKNLTERPDPHSACPIAENDLETLTEPKTENPDDSLAFARVETQLPILT
jgi:hypothetical protein